MARYCSQIRQDTAVDKMITIHRRLLSYSQVVEYPLVYENGPLDQLKELYIGYSDVTGIVGLCLRYSMGWRRFRGEGSMRRQRCAREQFVKSRPDSSVPRARCTAVRPASTARRRAQPPPSTAIASPTTSSRWPCADMYVFVCRGCPTSGPNGVFTSPRQASSTGYSGSPCCRRQRRGLTGGASADAGRSTKRTSVSPESGATRSEPSTRRAKSSTSTSAPRATGPQP